MKATRTHRDVVRNPVTNQPRVLYTEAGTVGLPDGFPFDSNYPYTYCRICGEMYQPPFQRQPVPPKQRSGPTEPNDSLAKKMRRRDWAIAHEKLHEANGTLASYARSGMYFTPEATLKLVPYGIIPLSEMVLSSEHEQAAHEAPRIPEV